jgi:hypothetical protein
VTRVLEWMAALRDHPKRPSSMQRQVLEMLALRLDWKTGRGFASTGQLADDADVDERTVRRATGWARGADMLIQTRRGHRLGDGRTVASEWRLVIPQPDSGDLLNDDSSTGQSEFSTGQEADLNRTERQSQPDTATPPSRPSTSKPVSISLSAPASGAGECDDERENDLGEDEDEDDEPDPDCAILAAAVPGADWRDIEWTVTGLQQDQYNGKIRSVRAYLRTIIANGDAQALVNKAAAERRRAETTPDPFGSPVWPATAPDRAAPWAPAAPFAAPVIVSEVVRKAADVWLTGTPETRTSAPPAETPKPRPIEPIQVGCPECGAEPLQYCRSTKGGHAAGWHAARSNAASERGPVEPIFSEN